MKDTSLRYHGPATIRQSYMNKFVVECPKCTKNALVTVEDPYTLCYGKLVCDHCFHIENANQLVRYKLIVNRYCDNCGKEININSNNHKEPVKHITVPCPHCGISRTYKPRNDAYTVKYTRGRAHDPIFGLRLWLLADFKGNTFWAYNYEHLREIKDYVSSKLRERQTASYTTMVEKLPGFIKQAKNREALIKVIERLEKKI